MRVGGVHVLLYRPSERAVVEDEIGAVLGAERVLSQDVAVHILLPDAETHVAHDKVLGASEIDLVACDDDALAGSRLTRQGPVLAADAEL